MPTRTVQITFTGEGGNYEATVQRMIDKNNQFNRGATQGAQQTASAFGEIQKILINFPSFLGGIASGIASAFSIGAIISFGKSIIDAAGQIDDLAKRTGFARQTLSGIKSTIEENGGTLEGFATAITKAQKSLGDITGDGRKAADAFKAMGLNVNDLVQASPEQFFEKFAKSLSQVENQNSRVTLATRVFSKAGADQIPIVLELADKFADLRTRGISDQDIKTLDDFGDAITRAGNQLKILVAGEIAEGLRDLQRTLSVIAQTFNALIPKELLGNFGGFNAVLRSTQKEILYLYELLLKLKLAFANSTSVNGQNFVFDIAGMKKAIEDVQKTRETLGRRTFEEGLAGAEGRPASSGKPINIVDSEKATAAAKAAEDQALRNAQAVAALQKQIDQANVSIIKASAVEGQFSQALHDAELAVIAQEKAEAIARAEKDQTIGATRDYIDRLAETKIKLLEATEAADRHREALKLLRREIEGEDQAERDRAALADAEAKNAAELKQRTLDEINLNQQLANVEGERLSAIGLTTQAERVRLLAQIQYLQKIKEIEDATPGGKDTSLRVAQIQTAQTQLQQLGVASVNVGHAIADTLNDIFTAAIQGTLKFSDIGKSLLAGVARTAGDFFTQILNKKLGFENLILSNVNQLPGQINNAFTSGAAGLPGGQSNGGGGLLNSFGGGGQGGGGGGIGGLLQGGIGNLLGNIFSNGGTTGFGSAPAGVAGPSMANGGFFSNPVGAFQAGGGSFFSGGAAIGGGLLSNLLNAGWQGQLGSVLGNIVGSLAASTAIGTAVTSSIATALGSVLGATLGGLLAGMVIPGIGAIIGVLISLLFKHVPNPTVFVKTVLGFFYDQSLQAFGFFESATITKALEIKGSKAKQVLADHQKILQDLGDKFSDLLNIFPTTVQEIVAAQMEDANRVLTDIFGSKKYTDLGSRNIKRELDDLKNKEGPLGFFVALRGALGAGLAQTLNLAGFGSLTDLVNRQLPLPPNPTPRDFPFRGGAGGLLPPEGVEEFGKFIDAMGKFIGFTATLANISPRGIQPFLTDQDKAAVQAQIAGVLLSPGDDFAKAVDDMLDRVKPIADFLEKSVTEASDLFGKGLIAAMEAVTASDANAAFLKNIGEGVKDKIFSGITEAFIASAQFTDLLAPIQQIIRQFTQDALASGQTPDIGAFRAALLPAIEDISTRAESLRPLIEALQALGFDVTHALESLIGSGTVGGGNNITINIENFNREDDPQQLARNIQDLLNGRTAP